MSIDKSRFILSIYQKDNTTFTIEWLDGTITHHRLADLQKNCPCVRCQDEKREPNAEEVSARRIFSVGRYALKIEFTTGCSKGIYSFAMLKELASK